MASGVQASELLDETVSPELVLVDPELAGRIRAAEERHRLSVAAARRQPAARPPLALVPPPPEPQSVESASSAPAEPAALEHVAPSSGQPGRARLAVAFAAGAILVGAVSGLTSLGDRTLIVPVAGDGATVVAERPKAKAQGTAAAAPAPTPAPAPAPAPAPTPKQAPTKSAPTPKTTPPAARAGSSGSGAKATQAPAARRAKATRAARPSVPTVPARRFAWAPVADAVAYRFELFRGSTRVFVRRTSGAVLELPSAWRYDGRTNSLVRGVYRWYVWPVLRDGSSDRAIVQATLSIR